MLFLVVTMNVFELYVHSCLSGAWASNTQNYKQHRSQSENKPGEGLQQQRQLGSQGDTSSLPLPHGGSWQ